MIKRATTNEATMASKRVTVPAAVAKKPAANASARKMPAASIAGVDEPSRRAMVAKAAYFRAEKRGFVGGNEINDWLEAEREIARMLGS